MNLGGGGFPAWLLPPDETGAGFARWVVKSVLGPLGLDRELTYDMTVVLSELATNVHLHAHESKAREIWAYRTWGDRPEMVFKVYDSAPWKGPMPIDTAPAATDDEGGRGFDLVHSLVTEHGGRWGIHRTRSRLADVSLPGKVVYVTVPLPRSFHFPRPVSARQAAEEVYELLMARGLHRMQISYGLEMAVICVRAGVHVWIRADSISYTVPGRETRRHVLGDVVEVAEQVIRLCTDC